MCDCGQSLVQYTVTFEPAVTGAAMEGGGRCGADGADNVGLCVVLGHHRPVADVWGDGPANDLWGVLLLLHLWAGALVAMRWVSYMLYGCDDFRILRLLQDAVSHGICDLAMYCCVSCQDVEPRGNLDERAHFVRSGMQYTVSPILKDSDF